MKPRLRTRPKLPAGMKANPRKRNRRQPRVSVLFSFGRHSEPSIMKRIARQTKRLKSGDAYLTERTLPETEAALFEGRHDRLREILLREGRKEARKRGLQISEENLQRNAEQVASELIRDYVYEPLPPVPGMERWARAENQLLQTLRAKGVRILMESLKEETAHKVAEINEKVNSQSESFTHATQVGNFKWAVDEFTKIISTQVGLVKLRDTPLYEKLRMEILERLQANQHGKIVVRLGEAHTHAYHLLRKEFLRNPQVQIKQRFDRKPMQYTLHEAFVRKIAFGKGAPKREQVVKAMFGHLVEVTLNHQGYKNEKLIVNTANAASEKITPDEVKAVFAEFKRQGMRHTDEIVLHWLEINGILRAQAR